MHRFDYYKPKSVAEAVALLREKGEGGKVLGGGTDLVPAMKERGRHPKYIVSIGNIDEMKGIRFAEGTGLRIGAVTKMMAVYENPVVQQRFNVLAQGAKLIGSMQTMNLATVGGNICNAAPSADAVPAFIVMDSVATIVGPNGSRQLPLKDVFQGPGQTVLTANEILTEVTVPTPAPRSAGVYVRHVPRKELDIAVAGVGVFITLNESLNSITHARVCLSSVHPVPLRVTKAEEALVGQAPGEQLFERAGQIASEECRPISDVRGSADFRRHLIRVLTQRTLTQAVEQIKSR
ncbi:MAG: xanthine dehydrogenase family protein subunit [Dehalococcoidia bacterium]|nr:xanthine dehydrogenase family protein subunit [Dehalococcoidia bacterium]